ncbi:Gfo/Idh/MocA family protein [Actinophytocola gossypii]|uniref:Gfo/Idh/MocA family oxidoreductase n=1 Tax=Actinophytocola gossypii TaxID=2812003 RepID=A0ABT2J5G6_9PSEU|nr:Gfo/Idh/MocA family oxidoreductase [Actinophytocola gossypii]MCT2583110.1 Gfo/Idh/MocA family oxidoreductase [Actinophytocola gossypii]
MRIALAGLATSHPFTDAGTLAGHAELVAWEDDPERRARFQAEHPTARFTRDLTELLATEPDGVVLTVPTPGLADALALVLAADLPCLVNKPAAATPEQLRRIDGVAAVAPHRVMSTSVLRFAPAFRDWSVDRDDVLAVRATVRHDVSLWASGYNPWQDDPAAGGGTLVTMGIHGLELLVSLLGPEVRLAGVTTALRQHTGLRSEDTAVLALSWDDGVPGTVEVIGATDVESYTVAVHTRAGVATTVIEPGPDPVEGLGYRATIEAFLDLVRTGTSPVPWTQTRAILDVLTAARDSTAPLAHRR